ncbi:MAG: NAD(P)/FAD-dependent oxidoreductase [Solobacterium sp.]|nr:NAD(P)/FAD-dependent oxidoreductase [Solobacterium sp.]
MKEYDLIIIGGGISGCAIARELSRYKLKVAILEKNSDIASGTTKANGGIIHAGDDPQPGTLKAKLNVRGVELYPTYAKELGFHYKLTGSMVVGFDEDDLKHLEQIYDNGIQNGVQGIELVKDSKRIQEIEPQCSKNAKYAVYCPNCGIVDPFEVAIAMCENAVENGVDVYLDEPVIKIDKENGFIIKTPKDTYHTTYVIDAAGLHADDVARLAGIDEYNIIARHGDLLMLDKECGVKNLMPLYPIPSPESKGVVSLSTLAGNVIVSATAVYREKDDTASYKEGIEELLRGTNKIVDGLNSRKVIRTFAGERAVVENNNNDFWIKPSTIEPNWFHVAGIQSPGVASAPALAEYVIQMLKESDVPLIEKENWNPIRKEPIDFSELTPTEQNDLIHQDPTYGKIVCRCETVTEGEILAALKRNPQPRTVEAIKRRTRAGMGRCQSGFCQSKVVLILARELGVSPSDIHLENKNSWILTGHVKEGQS